MGTWARWGPVTFDRGNGPYTLAGLRRAGLAITRNPSARVGRAASWIVTYGASRRRFLRSEFPRRMDAQAAVITFFIVGDWTHSKVVRRRNTRLRGAVKRLRVAQEATS